MGRGYVIDSCVSLFKDRQERKAFYIYATDALKSLTESIAHSLGGSYMQGRYMDVITPQEQDHRTAEEIVRDTIKRAGLKVMK